MSEPKLMKSPAEPLAADQEEGWWETIKVIVQALLIALVVRTVLFQPFNIPSGSLIPTLLIGDYLFVSKYSYGYSHYSLPALFDPSPEAAPGSRDLELGPLRVPSLATVMEFAHIPQPRMAGRLFPSAPRRGDIVVFRPPGQPDQDFIKRVIGLPGDKIQMIMGRLYINGVVTPREPAPDYAYGEGAAPKRDVKAYWETLPDSQGHPGGRRHEIIQIEGDKGGASNTDVFTVPPDHYFMMGDNRDNSEDSRFMSGPVGYVPAENLIGRAEIIFFSVGDGAAAWEFWRWPWTIRWSRLLMRIH
jgi:signal peptidase I